jgi:hypothetical protein
MSGDRYAVAKKISNVWEAFVSASKTEGSGFDFEWTIPEAAQA